MKKILKEIPKLEGSILLIGDLLAIEEKIEKNTKITEVFCLNNNNNSLDTDSETSESINNDFNLKHLHEYLKNGVDNVFCNYEEIKNEIPSFVREILRVAQEPVSLETPIGEEEDSHLGDFIPDDDALAPADAASMSLLKEQLADVLKTLTPREAKVLSLRFGLDDGNPKTLEEVGKVFNVTRERIRQIEAKALRKLRHPSRSKKLKDFLD